MDEKAAPLRSREVGRPGTAATAATDTTPAAAAQSVLDNPVWHALVGDQSSLGTVRAAAARFDADVAPFGAFLARPTTEDWREMTRLTGSVNRVAIVGGDPGDLPPGWSTTWSIGTAQMVLEGDAAAGDTHGELAEAEKIVPLGASDVDEMLELVALARPGPFLRRTVDFGGYVGVRHDGQLVAMAGERMRPPGYAEISAVATHPDFRGRGLGTRLVRAVAGAVVRRGEQPFLHVAHENETAIRLYSFLGFTTRRDIEFTVVEGPSVVVEEPAQPD
jgi:ribosomal protein S18 acetylase RimI-like enzyme